MTNGTGADTTIAQDFRHYDQLPPKVKAFYMHAPFNSFASTALGIQRKWTLDEDELLEEMQERMDRHVQRMVLETYGREHPQYRRETNEYSTD